MTFRNPRVETSPERDEEDHSTEPSVTNIEMWLEWQLQQLGTPSWWMELRAISGVRDLQKLTQKIWASFYIPKIQMRASLESEYTTPPAPKSLNQNAFLPNAFSCQDVQQQPVLLTITYARSLQHWAEQVSPLRSLDSCPLPLGREHSGTEGDGKGICCLQPLGCYARFRNDLHRFDVYFSFC